jgi:hypothetical protein
VDLAGVQAMTQPINGFVNVPRPELERLCYAAGAWITHQMREDIASIKEDEDDQRTWSWWKRFWKGSSDNLFMYGRWGAYDTHRARRRLIDELSLSAKSGECLVNMSAFEQIKSWAAIAEGRGLLGTEEE